MVATLARMRAQIGEWFARMPKNRRIQLAVLAVFVIVLAIVVVSLLTRTNWVLLPGTGDATSTAEVYSALAEMGEQTDIRNGLIYVPEERLGVIQMRLREQGLLGSAGFGLDIMSDAAGFGVTDAHARQLYDAQLSEHIRVALLRTPRIQDALVIVQSGETSPFRLHGNARQATAMVYLTLRGGGRLSQSEAQAIGDLVRTSVPGITYDNISITDSELNSYKLGDATDDIDFVIGERTAIQNRFVGELQTQVEQFLEPIYGLTNLRVQPSVRLNFDRVVSEQVEFFPPIAGEMDGIIRSSEEIYEFSRRWADAEGIPGTDTNFGAPEYPWGPLTENDDYRRALISKNMEINETRTMIERAQGVIEYVSIAILINSEIEGVEGDFTEEVIDLTARILGVSPAAANISVQHLPFAYEDTTLADMYERWQEEQAAARNRQLLETILMYAVIVLLGVMVLLLGRAIIKAVKPPPEPEPVLAVAEGPSGLDYIVGDDEVETRAYEDVDLNTKSAGLEQIERFIDKDSASVAQLLRNWLSDE